MSTEISSKERDQAEEEARKLMYKLMEVEMGDRDAVIKVGNDLLDLPAENIRDYELRELFEYALLDFQSRLSRFSRAGDQDLWDIQVKVILLGVRLGSPDFICQAEMLRLKEEFKSAQKIKKDSQEADKYLPNLYDSFKRLSIDE